ncbi:hypothetical protein IQ279_07285 [Streptomyces verrucosisporus]|uniref:hypothetical protein n=1 Tax=Streptomyces verrucosisporus TaxID=1695161 RepID=UPI0019D080A6|nr:hypothetical protein [Streptomyces verrucosisporus]MBN3929443.1 hypothetical protein [Streptomyces verrucosisporus]
MADSQFSARSRARAGAPTSGVIHVRTRLNANFTVLANVLAQRPGSAVTVGVAAYIASLPDGAPVSITALCEHFSEGEILISRALRELEASGHLERRRERGPDGRVRTRTYFHDVPPGDDDPDSTPPPGRRSRPAAVRVPVPAPRTASDPAPLPPAPAPAAAPPDPLPAVVRSPQTPSAQPAPLGEADPDAVRVLACLRNADPRLILSESEAARLAPDVARWLAAGVSPARITETLTAGLPERFLARPARILAFRLGDLPLPAPASAPPPAKPAVLPLQTCDGCERAIRAARPGQLCRDCRMEQESLRAAC